MTDYLRVLAHDQGRAVVVVSHDSRLEPLVDRIVTIEDGLLVGETRSPVRTPDRRFEPPRFGGACRLPERDDPNGGRVASVPVRPSGRNGRRMRAGGLVIPSRPPYRPDRYGGGAHGRSHVGQHGRGRASRALIRRNRPRGGGRRRPVRDLGQGGRPCRQRPGAGRAFEPGRRIAGRPGSRDSADAGLTSRKAQERSPARGTAAGRSRDPGAGRQPRPAGAGSCQREAVVRPGLCVPCSARTGSIGAGRRCGASNIVGRSPGPDRRRPASRGCVERRSRGEARASAAR